MMTAFELVLSAGTVAAASSGIAYVVHLVRVSGRDRLHDAERVEAMVRHAPMERLDNVLAK